MSKQARLAALAAALLVGLAGCGGGGGGGADQPGTPPDNGTVPQPGGSNPGGSDPGTEPGGSNPGGQEPGPGTPLAQPVGFWNGAVSGTALGASYARAVVLEDGRSWIFLHDGSAGAITGLVTARLETSASGYQGAALHYGVSGSQVGGLTLSGPEAGSTLQLAARAADGRQAALALEADARFAQPARQADVVANWRFSQEEGSITGTWTIDGNGRLTGSRSTGCSYQGTVRPHAGAAVYDVALTESCPGLAAVQLSGIAKLNSAATFLTFGLTTASENAGVAFTAAR